jgi:putative transcriptional regulator
MKNNLKYFRTKCGITQNALAKLINVSRQTISAIERQIYTPSVTLAINIAKCLNVTVERLFTAA